MAVFIFGFVFALGGGTVTGETIRAKIRQNNEAADRLRNKKVEKSKRYFWLTGKDKVEITRKEYLSLKRQQKKGMEYNLVEEDG